MFELSLFSRARSAFLTDVGLAISVCLLACAALAATVVKLQVELVDDAAISIAFGRSFFEGHGFRLTPHSQVVEGFSNPLWTLISGALSGIGGNGVRATQIAGTLLGIAALPLFMLWPSAAAGRALRVEDAAGSLFVAVSPAYAMWIDSGMETGLFALLLGASGLAALHCLRPGAPAAGGRGTVAGILLGLLCLTRPEAPVFVLALGAVWLAVRARQRRLPGRHELAVVGWCGGVFGGYLLFRWLYFASILPNTYYAKQTWDFDGANYLLGFLKAYPMLCGAAGVGFLVSFLWRNPAARASYLAFGFVAAGCFFAWFSNGDWMREWRFLAPLIPAMGVGISVGAARVRDLGHSRWGLRWPFIRWGAPLAVAAILIATASMHRLDQTRRMRGMEGELPYRWITQVIHRELLPLLKFGERVPRVGYPDIGGMGIDFRHGEVIDLAQLADYALARHAGNPRAQEDYLLHDALPTVLDIHGPSGHYKDMPKLMAQFRNVGGQFWVRKGMSKQEDPRCPDGRRATQSMDVETYQALIDAALNEGKHALAIRRWRCGQSHRAQMPDDAWRTSMIARLTEAAKDAVERDEIEPGLRLYSLATYLADDAPHLRRRTEILRARLFPRGG